MTHPGPHPLWKGRTLALVGIVLVASNLRTAVTAASPIVGDIADGLSLDVGEFGAVGILPPICFALFGVLTPRIARVAGSDRACVMALAAMIAGNALRASASDYWLFLVGSVLAFSGIGLANVLLPALVKRYFPDRIGLLSTAYAMALSIGIFIPPLIASPLAERLGWRGSLGFWAVTALVGLLPWASLILRPRSVSLGRPPELPALPRLGASLWRSKLAWSILAVFAMSGMNAYAMFAWLPQLLMERAHLSALAAGALLSLYGFMGIPGALLVPYLALKPATARTLVLGSAACYAAGSLGLLVAPGTTVGLWVALAGFGQIGMPIPFVLMTARTNSHDMASELSGFIQGIGYAISALGPLLFSLCRLWTGSWSHALVLLILTSGLTALAAIPIGRPTQVEDDLLRR